MRGSPGGLETSSRLSGKGAGGTLLVDTDRYGNICLVTKNEIASVQVRMAKAQDKKQSIK